MAKPTLMRIGHGGGFMTRSSGLLAVGLLGAVFGAWAGPAEACECRPRAEHATGELARHKSAFAGRVKDVRTEGDASVATFDVHRVWKGPRGKELAVRTSGACAASFEVGKDYLVYADGDEGALTADRCAQSLLGDASRSVRQLDLHTGRGATPLKVPGSEPVTARR
jgi:hypothetical protein